MGCCLDASGSILVIKVEKVTKTKDKTVTVYDQVTIELYGDRLVIDRCTCCCGCRNEIEFRNIDSMEEKSNNIITIVTKDGWNIVFGPFYSSQCQTVKNTFNEFSPLVKKDNSIGKKSDKSLPLSVQIDESVADETSDDEQKVDKNLNDVNQKNIDKLSQSGNKPADGSKDNKRNVSSSQIETPSFRIHTPQHTQMLQVMKSQSSVGLQTDARDTQTMSNVSLSTGLQQ